MYHQMPGVDMLGRAYDSSGLDGQFGNTRAIRELGSAANQAGWNRRLSETWGGAGWQISFAELKRLVDWQVALGVNFVNPHLSYYSMQGVRKFDYPPSFSYQEPWWDNFSLLGDYIGRICLAMSSGEQINNSLIIQPNTTAWMYHSTAKNDPRIYNISVSFKKFIQGLEGNHFEYDLGSEQVMKRFGENSKSGLKIRTRTYDHIILPPGIRNLETTTLNLLREYLSDGFTVLSFSDSIDYVDGNLNNEVKKLAAKYPINWIDGQSSRSDQIHSYLTKTGFSIRQLDKTKGQLFHQRRILDDGQLLFLVNSDIENSADAEIEITSRNLSEINLLNGLSIPVEYENKAGLIVFKITVPPGGSRLFVALNGRSSSDSRNFETNLQPTPVKLSGTLQTKRLSSNVLTLDYLDLETKGFKKDAMYFMTAMYKLFVFFGLKTGNPWQHKIQYKKQYLEMDSLSADTWFKARYHFTVDPSLPDSALKSLLAVIERPDQWQIKLNGKVLKPESEKWWLDHHFPVYSLNQSIKTGVNVIELSASKMTVFSELMPVYILGDFSLENTGKGFLIKQAINPGLKSWKESGMQFFGDQVSYSNSFIANATKERFFIELGNWRGSVSAVWVNGKLAGNIGWKPYELEITDFIQSGENQVDVRITGSLKNTLGYHHVVQSGWIDSPFSWNQGPEIQPEGTAYQFLDYGLFEEFKIKKIAK